MTNSTHKHRVSHPCEHVPLSCQQPGFICQLRETSAFQGRNKNKQRRTSSKRTLTVSNNNKNPKTIPKHPQEGASESPPGQTDSNWTYWSAWKLSEKLHKDKLFSDSEQKSGCTVIPKSEDTGCRARRDPRVGNIQVAGQGGTQESPQWRRGTKGAQGGC